MKILLVLTSAVAVFTADYRDNPGTPESELDYQPGDYNSADQNVHFSDNLVDSNAIEEVKNINDELSVRSFDEVAEILPAEPVTNLYSTDEDQETIIEQVHFTDGPPSLDYFEVEENYIKERKGRNEREPRAKSSDKILKQLSKSLETFKNNMTHSYLELKVELESIKAHQTNITNIGTELKEEQHYIRDNQYNLTDIITQFKVDLESIKEHQTNITNIGTELKEDQSNLTDIVTGFEEELQSIREHQDNNTVELKTEISSMNNKTSLIISKLDSIDVSRECPSEFFWHNSSKQCFQMFDTYGNWSNADARCRAEGLTMAEPKDPVTVGLYFMNLHSLDAYVWLGGKGDGSYIRWQRGGDEVAPASSLWYGYDPGSKVTTSDCLMILTTTRYLKAPWSEVYFSAHCTNMSAYTMCEFDTGNSNIAELKTEISSMNLNMNNKTSLILSKLDIMEAWLACPYTFFWNSSYHQCLTVFSDARRNWASADAKCRAEGLMLAKPKDPVEVGRYFTYIDSLTSYTWVGGKGNGSHIKWQHDGGEVDSGSSLWYSNHPAGRVSTGYCLMIMTTRSNMRAPWSNIYYSMGCTYSSGYTMCEWVNSG